MCDSTSLLARKEKVQQTNLTELSKFWFWLWGGPPHFPSLLSQESKIADWERDLMEMCEYATQMMENEKGPRVRFICEHTLQCRHGNTTYVNKNKEIKSKNVANFMFGTRYLAWYPSFNMINACLGNSIKIVYLAI